MTIASDNGFVVGRKYKLIDSYQKRLIGAIFVFDEDDGSAIPYFYGIVNGEIDYDSGRYCFNVDGDEDKFEAAEKDCPAIDYHVSVNPNSTTIVIQKRLTIEEVQAVIQAAGL